jgi:hypothetical protein
MVSEKKKVVRNRLYFLTFIGYFVLLFSILAAVWGAHNEGTYADWVELIGIGQSIIAVIGMMAMWLWYADKNWSETP